MKIRIKYISLLIVIFTFAAPSAVDAQQQTYQDYFKAGIEQTAVKDYQAAIKSYTECIRLNNKAPGCYGNRGYVYVLTKDYQAASADLSQAVTLSPQTGTFYYFRAQTLIATGKLDPALADLNKSLELGFKDADINFRVGDVYKWRGYIYSMKNDAASALPDYNKAIELVPNEPAFYLQRGIVYLMMAKNKIAGSDESAIQDFNKAIALRPKYAEAFSYRGTGYELRDDNDAALTDYSTAIQIAPDNDAYYLKRGTVYLNVKKYDLAFTDFNRVIELNPKLWLSYAGRGYIYEQRGNRELAIAEYKKALELNPSNDVIRAGLRNLGVQVSDRPMNPAPPENKTALPVSDLDRYNQISRDLASGKNVSDAAIKWALQYEKNHPQKP